VRTRTPPQTTIHRHRTNHPGLRAFASAIDALKAEGITSADDSGNIYDLDMNDLPNPLDPRPLPFDLPL